VRFAMVSPRSAIRARKFAASKFHAAWLKSYLSNGYAPVHDLIMGYYDAIKSFDKVEVYEGRKVCYDAMVMVNEYNKNSVPDFLYKFIDPE
jgi:hypothetical protein